MGRNYHTSLKELFVKLIGAAILLLIVCNSVFTQEVAQREMLTKEETINYINKKFKAAVGTNCRGLTVVTNFIELSGERVVYHRLGKYKDGTNSWEYEMSFNPALIQKIILTNVVEVFFPVKSVRGRYGSPGSDKATWDAWNRDGGGDDTSTISFCYDQSDPENFDKLKKAFLHLRDLTKAEDDPFGDN